MPNAAPACETATPWLPEDAATTPRRRAWAGSDRRAFVAPRTLKLPVAWRFSHLSQISAPVAPGARLGRQDVFDEWRAHQLVLGIRHSSLVSISAVSSRVPTA